MSSELMTRTTTALRGTPRNAPLQPCGHAGLQPTRIASTFTGADRHRLIAEAAFFRWERHGRCAGNDIADWLSAEQEVNAACGLIEPAPRWDIS